MSTWITGGKDFVITNPTLSTSDTEIKITGAVKSFVIRARTNIGLEFRRDEDDATFWTIKAGETLEGDILLTYTGDTTSIGWVRAVSGTPTLEVIAIF